MSDNTLDNFTLGTVQLGMPYGRTNMAGQPTEKDSLNILETAVKNGIKTFDTARLYGGSEQVIGKAKKEGILQNSTIITKLDHLNEITESSTKEEIIKAVRESVNKSLEMLGSDQLDVLMLHIWQHRYFANGSIWNELIKLKNSGLIKQLGASVCSTKEAIQAINTPEIKHIQLPFNIIDWRWEQANVLDLCLKRTDLSVYARSVLLQGILINEANTWPKIPGVFPNKIIEILNSLTHTLKRTDRTDLCISYVRSQKWINSLVIGVETKNQLLDNVKYFKTPLFNEKELLLTNNSFDHFTDELLNPARWGK